MTTRDELIKQLRAADEDDVDQAVAATAANLPYLPPADLLEFFNCMLDRLVGPDES